MHRIDKDTTGVLVICKNDRAHRAIAEQLSVHSITRAYYAIVYNNIKEDEGTVDAPIGRMDADRKKMGINHKNGRHAVTHYRVLERFGKYTYIECRLETGRTHQIRVHMASIGHPLPGILFMVLLRIRLSRGRAGASRKAAWIYPSVHRSVCGI